MFFVPMFMPSMNAAATNTSQPKTAVFQWLALQRPMRAAMLFERFRGDISDQLLFGVWVEPRSRRAPRQGGSPASWGAGFRTAAVREEPRREGARSRSGMTPTTP